MADYQIPNQSLFSELVNFFQQRRQNKLEDTDRAYRDRVRNEVMKATGYQPESGQAIQTFDINKSNLLNADRARQEQDQYKTDLQRVGEGFVQDYKTEPGRYSMSFADLGGAMSKSPEVLRTAIANLMGQRQYKQETIDKSLMSGQQNSEVIQRIQAEQSGQQQMQQGAQQFQGSEAEKTRQFEAGQREKQATGVNDVLKLMGIQNPGQAGYAGPTAALLQRDPQVAQVVLQQLAQATQPQVDKNGKVTRPPQVEPKQALRILGQQQPGVDMGAEILKQILQNDEARRQQVQRDLLLSELYKQGIDPQKYFAR